MFNLTERQTKKLLFIIATKVALAAALLFSIALPVYVYGRAEQSITPVLMMFPACLLLGSMALSMLLHNPFSEKDSLHYPFIISFALGGLWAPIFLYHISGNFFVFTLGLIQGCFMLSYALHSYRKGPCS